MVCIWKTVLPIILVLRFSFEKTIPHNEHAVQSKLIDNENLPDTSTSIEPESIPKFEHADSKEFTRHIFNIFWNIIIKAYHVGEIDVQYFRSTAYSLITLAKSELADVVESVKSAYQLINKSHFERGKLFKNITRPYDGACQAMEALINLSTTELQSCCNITIKPLIFLCRNIRSLLISSAGYMADIAGKLNQLHHCFENSIMSPDQTMQCINSTFEEIINLFQNLSELIRKFDKLMHVKILYSRCCISLVIVDVQN